MALFQNSAEGGTNGTNVTSANSGGNSGDKFNTVTPGTGTLTYDTAAAAHGLLGYNFTSSGTGSGVVSWNAVINLAPSVATRVYFNPGSTLPSSLLRLVDIRNTAGTAVRVQYSATNHLLIQNAAGTTLFTSSTAVSANTWYRIELAMSVSATGATINYDYYLLDSTIPVEAGYSTTTGNTGTTYIITVSMGSAAAATNVGAFYMDDFAINTGTTSYIGPVPVAAMPWIEA